MQKCPSVEVEGVGEKMGFVKDTSSRGWRLARALDVKGFQWTEGRRAGREYTSGSFKAAEKNYHSNEKELLAVKNVISKFSDSKQGRLVRWQAWFSHYSFKTEHLPGNKNVLADCLTRDFRNN
ncbi:hypothetical protein Tco_0237522 [Tanacetum coccineum]